MRCVKSGLGLGPSSSSSIAGSSIVCGTRRVGAADAANDAAAADAIDAGAIGAGGIGAGGAGGGICGSAIGATAGAAYATTGGGVGRSNAAACEAGVGNAITRPVAVAATCSS